MTDDAQGFLVGLVGSGIGPSLTPPLHEREADELGLRYLYRRLDLDQLQRPASAVVIYARGLASSSTHSWNARGLRRNSSVGGADTG